MVWLWRGWRGEVMGHGPVIGGWSGWGGGGAGMVMSWGEWSGPEDCGEGHGQILRTGGRGMVRS